MATGAFLIRGGKGLELASVPKKPPKEKAVPPSVVAFLYTEPSGADHWVSAESNLNELKAYLRREELDGTISSARDEDFARLSRQFAETVGRSTNPLIFLIAMGKLGVPIMTPKTVELLDTTNFHYRSTIADLLFIKDLSNINALVHVNRKKGDTAQIKIPEWLEGVRWLTRKWFGCETIDGAVTVKMSSPSATIIEL